MKRWFLTLCFLLGTATVCVATQPDCTGDRHLDECGQLCPDPTTTTTTTLSDAVTTTTLAGCGECQPVVCVAGPTSDTTTNFTTVIAVDRCPVQQPTVPCKLRADGKARPGDTLTVRGPAKCPRRGRPHWINVPADQVGIQFRTEA